MGFETAITALRKMVSSTASGTLGWGERLERAVESLAKLNGSTEKEFLVLCERLQDFYLRAKEISELSSSISARMSGEEAESVVAELRSIINRLKGLEDESQNDVATLTSILKGFESIRKNLAVFGKVVMILHMLCNSLRIESARIRESDSCLSTLVDDIKQLAANIEMRSDHLLNQADAMSNRIRENLTAIVKFKNMQQGRARLILQNTGENLTALTDRRKSSSVSMNGFAARWNLISRSIGEIVSSIQFQDITRQRIEHVIETLNGIHRNLNPQSAAKGRNGLIRRFLRNRSCEYIPEAIAGCELQAAQLDHGKEEMTAAVNRIIGNLRDVAVQTGAISEETKAVAGWDGDAGQSYFEELRSGLSALVKFLAEYTDLSRELGRATGQVSETIGQMTMLVKEIEKIGIDMNMVALNACIHAAQIGEAGLGLGVLAESLHQLSVHTTEQIETIASNLKTLISTASGLAAETDAGKDREDVGNQMTHHLEGFIKPLHEVHMDTAALLSRMEEAGKVFVSDIEKTVGGITVHGWVEGIIQEVNADLNTMISEMRSKLPEGAVIKRGGELGDAVQRYTMHSEREIHNAILLADVPAQPVTEESDGFKASQVGTEKKKSEDLGDNVDLF